MNWIKKHPDQFSLALLAILLLAVSAYVVVRAMSFEKTFSAVATEPVRNDNMQPLDLSKVQSAREEFANPTLWQAKETYGSLFQPWKYMPDSQNPDRLIRPDREGMQHPPIPNTWFTKYGIDPLSSDAPTGDPDKDGFTSRDEYFGEDRRADDGEKGATDPTDPKSHPPYYVTLFLQRWIQQQFRLIFNAHIGDIKKPESLDFQINTLEPNQTLFLKLGELVPNTKYKVGTFKYKTRLNLATDVEEDVSELTVINTEDQREVVLVLKQLVNSPDSSGVFDYKWLKQPRSITVPKGGEFALMPETDKRYKLIDINDNFAEVGTPDGKKVQI
ncbi:MAG: hypothetical protein M3463_12230, partial [Verrucomicrobiota bacterium]|nr:hypothetical protein [Verrucomicrobiota bacterium]